MEELRSPRYSRAVTPAPDIFQPIGLWIGIWIALYLSRREKRALERKREFDRQIRSLIAVASARAQRECSRWPMPN